MYGEQQVTNLWQYEKPTYRLELSDGQVLQCSPEHKFLVANDAGHVWKIAQDISEQDEILAIDGSKMY
jgi:intein/homing endonuclease